MLKKKRKGDPIMKIGVNCGHTKTGAGTGAVGYLIESNETRNVGYKVMEKLKALGHTVVDCTINKASSTNAYLESAVTLANNTTLDWFVSIHFNAGGGRGVEVYTYEGRQYEDAVAVCKNIEKLGFKNRGVKAGTGLYVIRKTKAKSMLVEVCFVDTKSDADLYKEVGIDAIAQAIVDGILVNAPKSPVNDSKVLYRVQVGAFTKKASVDHFCLKLKDNGFDSLVVKDGKYYKVQVGAYSVKSNAEKTLEKLQDAGYTDAFISYKK